MNNHDTAPNTNGRVLHWPLSYDLLVSLLLLGRERALRERLMQLARIGPGQSVLDIGCGTGTLAIEAKRCVGASGTADGIDASPEMIGRARTKAAKAGLEVTFSTAVAEALPFADERFDAVLTTLMLHHLPDDTRRRCVHEMGRVLKRGGRVLAVDFGRKPGSRKSFFDRIHHRHGSVEIDEIVKLLTEAGLRAVDSGRLGILGLNFVLASRP